MRFRFTLSLILLLSSLCLISAEVQHFDLFANDPEIVENLHKIKSLESFLEWIHEMQKIVSGIKHVRHIVQNRSTETIEVMDLFNTFKTSKICHACENFVGLVRKFDEQAVVRNIVEKAATLICRLHWKKDFCHDIIRTYGDIVYEVLVERALNSHIICQRFRMCPRTDHAQTIKEYVEEVLKDKPQTNVPIPSKKETYKILHLTDPHIDFKYEIGANAFCHDPFCCRPEYGFPPDPTKGAQYWGTLGPCDMPERTFEQFLQYASKNLQVDMIIWTGDNIAHDIWHQNQENQTMNTLAATLAIKKYFPNTTIYPMFGNHEPYPADQLDLFGNKSDWLIQELSAMWQDWLGPEAFEHFQNHTYYATVNPKYNLKVIALDTQVCDSLNFYLIRDPTDPLKQLEWLRKELYDSEAKGHGVILMGHIPPGDFSCDSEWAARYRALVDRFTNIIRGQFFGHTHMDQFQVVRSFKDNTPVGTYYISPSFTTFAYVYPSFRVFEMDSATNQPIDYYQYRLDLNKWNNNHTGPIDFDLAYTFLKEYNLTDMSFQSLDNLAERFMKEPDTVLRYAFNFDAGGSPVTKLTKRETHHYYCIARESVSFDALKCLGIDASVLDLMLFASQLLPGIWHFDKC